MTTANKALLGGILAGLTSVVTDLRGADHTLTFQDWVVTALAALVTGAVTYVVPNYTRGGVRKEGGYSAIELAVGVILLLILVVVLFRLL